MNKLLRPLLAMAALAASSTALLAQPAVKLITVDIGKVFGATSGIDIDAFGFGPADEFRFVRLTDDPNEGETIGPLLGADIDAVGAISSRRVRSVTRSTRP